MTSSLIRRSSSLIIASKCTTPTSSTGFKYWKNVGPEDYAVTLLKRSSSNNFMPDAVVFPGGAYHAADSNLKWLNLFKKSGVSPLQIRKLFRQPDAFRAGTYKRLAEEMKADIPSGFEESLMCPELSLRLTALRETFEETGLLLAQPYVGGEPLPPLAFTERGSFPVLTNDPQEQITDLGGKTLQEWRAAVNADACKFLDLFVRSSNEKKTLLPWVEGLVEWWGWFTPQTFARVRFDTIFYTALLPALEFQSDMLFPCNESSELMVLRLSEAVAVSRSKGSWLAPPQMYEFGRLANFPSLELLREHVLRRTGSGGSDATAAVQTWLPRVYLATDGVISTMPGDVLYCDDYTVTEKGRAPQLYCTMEALRRLPHSYLSQLLESPEEAEAVMRLPLPGPVVSLNRLEVSSGSPHYSFQSNVGTEYGQVAPVDLALDSESTKSSL